MGCQGLSGDGSPEVAGGGRGGSCQLAIPHERTCGISSAMESHIPLYLKTASYART